MRLLAPLPLVVLLLGPLAGCGEDFTRESAVASFAEANPEATEVQAGCVVDRLIEQYGIADLEAELAADSPDPAFEESQFSDMFLCGMEGDVTDQLTDQLTDAGIPAEDAPCVADALVTELTEEDVGVLLSGEITESFSDKFYTAAESCDALG